MKILVRKALAMLALVVGITTAATAAIPVAVWDGDFTKTVKGYTLDLNGNAAKDGVITISQTQGVKVNWTTAMNSGMTVLFKYCNLTLGSQQAIATSCINEDGTGDRTGVYLDANNKAHGIWNNTSTYDKGVTTQETMTDAQSLGTFALTYKGGSGTYLYRIADAACTCIYGNSGLKSKDDTRIYGCTVGGTRGTTFAAATGLKVSAIAIFNGVLSPDEMAAYIFPSDITTYTATIAESISFAGIENWEPERPESFRVADDIVFIVKDNSTLTLDESLTIGTLKVVSGEDVLLSFKKDEGVSINVGIIDLSEAENGVAFNAEDGYNACSATLEAARTTDSKFTFFGEGENGAMLDYGTTQNNYTFNGHYIFDGGAHVFQNCSESATLLFGANATEDNPTFWVRDGATLTFKSRNPCGWNASASTAGIIRIGEDSKVVLTNSAAGTWYWSQQFCFDDGATLAVQTAGDNFRIVGGDTEGAPQFYLPKGAAQITGLEGNYLALPANDRSGAAFNVGEDATLTISANLKSLASGKPFAKHGAGTLALTGDLSAFDPAFTIAKGMVEIATTRFFKQTTTFTINEGASLVLNPGDGVFTNKCAMTNDGAIEVRGGTVFFMPNTFNGKITENGGKAIFCYTVGINDCGKFTVPSGIDPAKVKLYTSAGAEVTITGVEGQVISFDLSKYGTTCLMEYLFKGNLNSTGSDTGSLQFDGTHCFTGNEYVTDSQGEKSGGIYAASAPWRNVTFPSEVTVVMYGKVMNTDNTCQIGIGSTTRGSKYSLFLASGDVEKEEVKLCYAYNNKCSGDKQVEDSGVLCTMSVPHAQTTDHLYAFTIKKVGDDTVVNIYLDGEVLQPYTFKDQTVILGSGIQLGSIHGGIGNSQTWPDAFGFKRSTADETDATLQFVRVYNIVLNDTVLREMAKDYPYASPAGSFSRELTGDCRWVESKTWTKAKDENKYDKPDAGSAVTLTPTAEEAVDLTVNIDAEAAYETLTINQGCKVVLKSDSEKAGVVNISGKAMISTDVTVAYDAIKFGNVTLADGKTLMFDFANLSLGSYFTSHTIKLTGVAILGKGATVAAANLRQVAGRTATFGLNPNSGHYELKITVDDHPFVITVAEGSTSGTWTWNGQTIDVATVEANPKVLIEKWGAGTYGAAINRTFLVKEGTLKATSVGTARVTVEEGATFDINGKINSGYTLVLNGGKLINGGSDAEATKRQYVSIGVTADSEIGGMGAFGYITDNWGANTLDLGGATLTKTGANLFTLCNSTVQNGTLLVADGTLNIFKKPVAFTDTAELKVGAEGTLSVGANLTAATLTGSGSVTIAAGKSLSVGTLTGGCTFGGEGAVTVTTKANYSALAGRILMAAGTIVNFPEGMTYAKKDLTIAREGALTIDAAEGAVLKGTFVFPKADEVTLTEAFKRACKASKLVCRETETVITYIAPTLLILR